MNKKSLVKSLFIVPAILIGMNVHSHKGSAEEIDELSDTELKLVSDENEKDDELSDTELKLVSDENEKEDELKIVTIDDKLDTLNEYESKLQKANSLVNTVPVNNQKQQEEIEKAQEKLDMLKESTIKLNEVVDKLDSVQSQSTEVKEKIEELKSTAKELESKKEQLIKQIDEMKQKKEKLAAEKAEKERIAAEEAQRKLDEQAKKEEEEQAESSPTQVSVPVSVGGLEFGPDGLLVESATSNAQQVINLLLSIPGHANGAWYHAQTGLDTLIDQLSTPEAVHVIHRIEGAGFGQTGDGWAGIDSAQSHQNFVNKQVNGRFGGSVHALLKSWGTYSYGGY